MARHTKRDPTLTPAAKTWLRRKIDREWLPELSPSEAKCLTFLFNIVTDWSKTSDRVKQEQFVSGTANIAGTGLSLRTVIRALASLAAKGAVTRLRTPRGHVYGIDFTWDPTATEAAPEVVAEPTPAPEEAPVICQTGTSRYAKLADANIREVPLQEIPSFNRPADQCAPAEIKEEIREKARDTPYVDPLDITRLQPAWTAALAETFPDLTPSTWTRKQEAQACQFVRVPDKGKRLHALDVLIWAARSWRMIMAARFAWMTEHAPPVFPDIGFMLRFKDRFFDAWADRERLRQDMAATGDQRRLRKLLHAGLTPEEARTKIAEGSREAGLRDELERTRSQLNSALRRSEATALASQRAAVRPQAVKARPIMACIATSAALDCEFA